MDQNEASIQQMLQAAQAQAVDPMQVQETGVYTPPPQEQVNPALQMMANHDQIRKATQMGVTVPQLAEMEAQPALQIQSAPIDKSAFVAPPQNQVAQNTSTAQVPGAAQVDGSYNREMAAIKAYADAGALKGAEKAAEYDRVNQDLEMQHQRDVAKRADIERRQNDEMSKFERLGAEMNNFEFKDYWADKTTGDKIMAGLAIALGGIGGAFTGKGDNKGLEVINAAIDRDLQLQKLNFDKLRNSGEQSKTALGLLNQQFDNQVQAEAAYRAYAMQKALNKLEQIGAKHEGPEIQARIAQIRGPLERQQVAAQQQYAQAAQMKALMGEALAGGQSTGSLTGAQLAMLPKEIRERVVPGFNGMATTEKDAQDFKTFLGKQMPAVKGVQRVLQLSKDLNRITDQAQLAQIKTELGILRGQLREPILGPGTMTEDEYKRLSDTIGDPTKLATLPSWERVKLNTVLRKMTSDMNEAAVRAGLQPQTPQNIPYTRKNK